MFKMIKLSTQKWSKTPFEKNPKIVFKTENFDFWWIKHLAQISPKVCRCERFASLEVHRYLTASSKFRAFHAPEIHSNDSLTPTNIQRRLSFYFWHLQRLLHHLIDSFFFSISSFFDLRHAKAHEPIKWYKQWWSAT